MSASNIKWGIIGCGNVTEAKSGPAFQKVKGSELVAVMRRDRAKAEDYSKRHGVAKWYSDADELIGDGDVDAVYVATPPDSHKEYAVKVMKAGKPVYVEKPMARTVEECDEMLRVSKETGQKLFVAYYRRELPGFKKVEELLKSGDLGKPTHVDITLLQHRKAEEYSGDLPWRVRPEVSGGGLFYDLGSHQFDVLDMLLGPIKTASGEAANPRNLHPCEEVVSASFQFESGVIGTGKWNFCVPPGTPHTDTITITCTDGIITFSAFDFAPVRVVTPTASSEYTFPRPEHVQYYLIEKIVAELRDPSAPLCASTGVSATRTNWVLNQIVGKYYEQK